MTACATTPCARRPCSRQSCDRIHFDEAWYGYARFNPMYNDHFAMRGDPAAHRGPTVFATHSTHKLLAALSQASYIHVRDGKGAIDHHRFNQAYMMHTTTSPLYAIVASNDITSAMMDGSGGRSLTQEAIEEAVDFRQVVGRLWRTFADKKDWFFKPWNVETVKNPTNGHKVAFEDAPADLLCRNQEPWVLHPGDKWHGFDDIADDWCMLDPIKVSILTPGMGEDGKLEKSGVPAALVNAWFNRFGIVPTRVTDFQVMFLFSIGITKGKWGTLLTNLLAFKRAYDFESSARRGAAGDRRAISRSLPQRPAARPRRRAVRVLTREPSGRPAERCLRGPAECGHDAARGLRAPGRRRRRSRAGRRARQAHGGQRGDALSTRHPDADVGREFRRRRFAADRLSAQHAEPGAAVPGFAGVIEGAELIDGTYHVLCVKM